MFIVELFLNLVMVDSNWADCSPSQLPTFANDLNCTRAGCHPPMSECSKQITFTYLLFQFVLFILFYSILFLALLRMNCLLPLMKLLAECQ